MNNMPREKWLLLLAAVALGLLIGDRLIMTPLLASWKDRSERITLLKNQVDRGQTLLDREDGLRSRWSSIQQNSLPPIRSVSENQLLEKVDQWVNNSRLTLTAFKPNWREYEAGHWTLECRITSYGSLDQIVQFLYDLETDSMALKIDQIELTQQTKDGARLGLTLQFSGLQLPEDFE